MDSECELTKEEQIYLLKIARQTIIDYCYKRQSIQSKKRKIKRSYAFSSGVFVTIYKRGRLRGCIGNFSILNNITDAVCKVALAAVSQDYRFSPLQASELIDVNLEISVLSSLRLIKSENEIIIGEHGLYIINSFSRGVFLPQVAVEYNWDRYTFLDQVCLKAGLRIGCWRESDVKVFIFSAQIFREKDLGLI